MKLICSTSRNRLLIFLFIYFVISNLPINLCLSRYQADPISDGEASDYGKSLNILRVHPQDAILYQTERYHSTHFSYDLPLREDGDYALVLKFCEVWFNAPNQKVGGAITALCMNMQRRANNKLFRSQHCCNLRFSNLIGI